MSKHLSIDDEDAPLEAMHIEEFVQYRSLMNRKDRYELEIGDIRKAMAVGKRIIGAMMTGEIGYADRIALAMYGIEFIEATRSGDG